MAVFRIEKTRDYTVMSNHHLRNAGLSLKSKGLLSMMLSLPEDWNYTTRGLAKICKEGTDSIGSALKELERTGYIVRNRLRDSKGKIVDVEYVIYETPHPPDTGQPCEDEPDPACPKWRMWADAIWHSIWTSFCPRRCWTPLIPFPSATTPCRRNRGASPAKGISPSPATSGSMSAPGRDR